MSETLTVFFILAILCHLSTAQLLATTVHKVTTQVDNTTSFQCSLNTNGNNFIFAQKMFASASIVSTSSSSPVDFRITIKTDDNCVYLATDSTFEFFDVKKKNQPFMFHIGGPCLPTAGSSKIVSILFTTTYNALPIVCNFTHSALGGYPSGLFWEQVTAEPIISGFPISPELSLRVVDSYGNPITADQAAGTAISATISVDSSVTIYGNSKANSVQGRIVFTNLAIAAKLVTDPQKMLIHVSSTPALITPQPHIISLQNGVSSSIQVSWNTTYTSVDICTTPASIKVPLDFEIPIKVQLFDPFSNEILIGNYGLCGAKGLSTSAENCINATLSDGIDSTSLIILDKKTLLLNTSSHFYNSDSSLLGKTLSIRFYFPRTKLYNVTYFQIRPADSIRCFPDIIKSTECVKSISTLNKYFISHMVTAERHLALQSQFKTSSRQLARFAAKYDLGVFSKIPQVSSMDMDYFVVSKNEFFLNLGYNFSQYWSMNLRPDFLEDVRINFTYPFCSNSNNATFSVGSTEYSSQRLQQLLLMNWLSTVTFNTPVEGQEPRFLYFCHSSDSIVSEYLGVDASKTRCCNLDSLGICGNPPQISDVNRALLALQITIAILGAIYSVYIFYSIFEWRQWEAEGKILKYDIPLLKFLLKSEKFKHIGLILQRMVLIFLGAVPLIVCWVISLQAVIRSVLTTMTAAFLGVISAVLVMWVIIALVWQLFKYVYVHTNYRKLSENTFEKVEHDNVAMWKLFYPCMIATDAVYFFFTCLNVFVSAYMIFMFISWTILGLIIDPTKAAPYFAAFAAVIGTAAQIYVTIKDAIDKTKKTLKEMLKKIEETTKTAQDNNLLKKNLGISNRMIFFHVGMFVLIAAFFASFILLGVSQFVDLTILQSGAAVALQVIQAQAVKYFQQIISLKNDIEKFKSRMEKVAQGKVVSGLEDPKGIANISDLAKGVVHLAETGDFPLDNISSSDGGEKKKVEEKKGGDDKKSGGDDKKKNKK